MKEEADETAGSQEQAGTEGVRECHDCGLFQRIPEGLEDAIVVCVRCGAVLRRVRARRASLAVAGAIMAALLLVFAVLLPVIELHVRGRFVEATALGGPRMLNARGAWELALVVAATLLLAPASKPAIVLGALAGARFAPRSRVPAWVFGWLERISPWAMVDVFVLGVIVATTRLRSLGQVDVGPALLALAGVALTDAALDRLLDHDDVWLQIDSRGPSRHTEPPRSGRWIACGCCRLVNASEDGGRCARCGHALHARKVRSLTRTWALTIAAALLYIPANALPIMDLQRLGRAGPSTILRGVQELMAAHLWVLAVVVVCASVAVPLLKLLGVGTLLVMTRRRSTRALRSRTRWFRFIRGIGRWSMVDIFVLSTLVALVRLGFVAVVLPGAGATAFCAVVVATMCATEFFDPRLMWDAAGANPASPIAGRPSPSPTPRPELDPA